jgi:hypothetical protein
MKNTLRHHRPLAHRDYFVSRGFQGVGVLVVRSRVHGPQGLKDIGYTGNVPLQSYPLATGWNKRYDTRSQNIH